MILLLAGCFVFGIFFVSEASDKKKISKVPLNFKTEVMAGMEFEESDMEIKTSSQFFYVDGYEMINEGVEWEPVAEPMVEITLAAREGCYFHTVKKEDINLSGNMEPVYVSHGKIDSYTLVVKVKLKNLIDGIGELGAVEWDRNRPGTAKWESAGTNEHEVALYRGGKKTGTIQRVSADKSEINLSGLMQKSGSYYFMVRECNVINGKKGEWISSGSTEITEEMALKNQSDYGKQSISGYGWQKAGNKWRYCLPGNFYLMEEWLKDNERWYYFDENGYMVSGWKKLGEAWHYFNTGGEMLLNTKTPDGYRVDENGRWEPEGS